MAFNLEEQEQLATINDWWRKYGSLVTWVVIIALAGYAGWGGWKYYQNSQAAQASQLIQSAYRCHNRALSMWCSIGGAST